MLWEHLKIFSCLKSLIFFFFFFFQVLKKYSESNFFVFKIIVYLFLFFFIYLLSGFFQRRKRRTSEKETENSFGPATKSHRYDITMPRSTRSDSYALSHWNQSHCQTTASASKFFNWLSYFIWTGDDFLVYFALTGWAVRWSDRCCGYIQ